MKKHDSFIKGKMRSNESISRHTTFRIGGIADKWAEPLDMEDLQNIIKLGKKLKKPIYTIGGGSNLLVSDKKINGIFIRLSSPFFRYIRMKGASLTVGAGASLRSLLDFCIENGLTGLEFCSGIPGTVGGSVAMNAGLGPKRPESNIGNFVNQVTVSDKNGRIKTIKKKDLKFGYRTSSLGGFIVLEAEFCLKRARKDYIKKQCIEILEKKNKSQDCRKSSAGCVFKNPYGGFVSAGKLLDLAGMKKQRIGDAEISEKNANYIINLGNAKFNDVKKLIDIMRGKVKEEFNIDLELEVKICK